MTTLPQPANPSTSYTGTYDAWNRLVKLVDPSSGNLVQTNAYDGRTFRTIRDTYTTGVLTEIRHLYYTAGWQDIEERLGTSTSADRQFVWGRRFIDALILRDRDAMNSGVLNERLYALQDPNWNFVGVSNSTGAIQERYSYDAYGLFTLLTPGFRSQSSSTISWESLYGGNRCDLSTGLYIVRNRVLSPNAGTWLQRDPLGMRDGINLYAFLQSQPTQRSDPSGLQAEGGLYIPRPYGTRPPTAFPSPYAPGPNGWEEMSLSDAFTKWFEFHNPKNHENCRIRWNQGCFGVASAYCGADLQHPANHMRCYANVQDATVAQLLLKNKCNGLCYSGKKSQPRLIALSFKDFKSWWDNNEPRYELGPDGRVNFIWAGGRGGFANRYDFQYFRDEDGLWYGASDTKCAIRTDNLDTYLDGNVYGKCGSKNALESPDDPSAFNCRDKDDPRQYRWIRVWCVVCEGNNPAPGRKRTGNDLSTNP
ncbi:MAG: hypothetical protein JSS02_31535 [Planctomycetes bacterium]|nr:hypothetical protein [Planctomycetota bacterium]